jgi:predicted PurR-regulated permease PerM
MVPRDSYKIVVQSKKLTTLFWVIFIALIAVIGFIYRYYFWPFLFAIIFYIGLKPLYIWLCKYLKIKVVSSFAVIVIIIITILLPTFILLVNLADQVMEFYNLLQLQFDPKIFKQYFTHNEVIKNILNYFKLTQDEVFQRIVRYMQDMSLMLFSNLTNILTFSIRFFINFFFMLLILFFLFKDNERFEKSMYTVSPFPEDIERDMVDTLKNCSTHPAGRKLFYHDVTGYHGWHWICYCWACYASIMGKYCGNLLIDSRNWNKVCMAACFILSACYW